MIKTSLSVPREHLSTLINPSGKDLHRLISENCRVRAGYDFAVAGVPVNDFISSVRQKVLVEADAFARRIGLERSDSGTETIIQAGHQPELYHPGVWLKNYATHRLAGMYKCTPLNMIVDNDVAKMAQIAVPSLKEGAISVERAKYAALIPDVPYEELQVDSETLRTFTSCVVRAISKTDMKESFERFAVHLHEKENGPSDYVDTFCYARVRKEESLGIRNLEIRLSDICDTDEFLLFVLHVASQIDSFVNIYNCGLDTYRKLHGIRSKANPLPNLKMDDDCYEMPFWTWRSGGERSALYVRVRDQRVTFIFGDGEEVSIPHGVSESAAEGLKDLRRLIAAGHKIRSRALTTTMFSRLFISDLFIHGIGGAKYDTITDEIIRDFFGVEPLGYATMTGTLHLPFRHYDTVGTDVNALRQHLRDMRYNPDRHLAGDALNSRESVQLVGKKQLLIKQQPQDHAERKQRFEEFREISARLRSLIRPHIDREQKRLSETERQAEENRILRGREYAFCLYPDDLLRALHDAADEKLRQ